AHTGRSPKDRYVVEEPSSADQIAWGAVNQPMSSASFDRLLARVCCHLERRELFVCDAVACADPAHGLPVRVVASLAWHALFAQCLLRAAPVTTVVNGHGDLSLALRGGPESPLTVIAVPEVKADPAEDGTRGETFIALHLARRLVLIGGTRYAGE